jgi:hypothetical protein
MLVTEYVEHYHLARNQQGLDNLLIDRVHQSAANANSSAPVSGKAWRDGGVDDSVGCWTSRTRRVWFEFWAPQRGRKGDGISAMFDGAGRVLARMSSLHECPFEFHSGRQAATDACLCQGVPHELIHPHNPAEARVFIPADAYCSR